jgi:hypothetical protein
MANRYWVAATANTWNGTAGTKWSTTSGGTGGAAVPTAADDVFFDASSPSNCTTLGARVCRSLNFTGYTKAFTFGTSSPVSIGDASAPADSVALKFSSGMSVSFSGILETQIVFVSTYSGAAQTITTAGKSLGNCVVQFGPAAASSAIYSLSDAITSVFALSVRSGIFRSNGNNITADSGLTSTTSNAKTIDLGTSTVTINIGMNGWAGTNTTFSVADTKLVINGGPTYSQTIDLAGQTWGDLEWQLRSSGATADLTQTLKCAGASVKTLLFNVISTSTTYKNTVGIDTYPTFFTVTGLRASLFGAGEDTSGPFVVDGLGPENQTYLEKTGLASDAGIKVLSPIPCILRAAALKNLRFFSDSSSYDVEGRFFACPSLQFFSSPPKSSIDNGGNSGIRFTEAPMYGKQSMLGCGI